MSYYYSCLSGYSVYIVDYYYSVCLAVPPKQSTIITLSVRLFRLNSQLLLLWSVRLFRLCSELLLRCLSDYYVYIVDYYYAVCPAIPSKQWALNSQLLLLLSVRLFRLYNELLLRCLSDYYIYMYSGLLLRCLSGNSV
jgi:hypothetical protein